MSIYRVDPADSHSNRVSIWRPNTRRTKMTMHIDQVSTFNPDKNAQRMLKP